MRTRNAALLLSLSWAAQARAHGGQPQVLDLVFPAPGIVWALTDNQGVFAVDGDGARWLCEDSITPGAAVRAGAITGRSWLISTTEAVHVSTDAGCRFAPIDGPLGGHRTRDLAPHPERADDLILATDSFGRANDVFRTVNGGRTWDAAGLAVPGQFTSLHRAPADPRRIYAVHERGGERSDDAGRTFSPLKLGPPELEAQPTEFTILGTAPGDADVLFAAIERFDTLVVRSTDGGQSWSQVVEVPDFPLTLVISADGREALLHGAFSGYQRSGDGGMTWAAEAQPVERLGCLRRAPGAADTLWACSNVFFGGPWVVGRSDDFGRTWRPVLSSYAQTARWTCPVGAPGRDCCQHLCAGEPVGGMCAGQAAGPGPACGGEGPPPDLGVVDSGIDATVDASLTDAMVDGGRDSAPDITLDAVADAAVEPRPDAALAPAARSEGCRATEGPAPWPLFAALFLIRRRRR